MVSLFNYIKQKANSLLKKSVSGLLVFSMLFQMSFLMSIKSSAEEIYEISSSSAHSQDYISVNGVVIDRDVTLLDNNDGTFTLDIRLSSTYSEEVKNYSATLAENGTFSITHDGWYLLELWGGKGASVEGAGTGGNEGHVYAKVYLTAGQTLFYTLGSDGIATQKSELGGGANGSGGDHGLVGASTVGGGGGYSAVFLYETDEFIRAYGTLNAKNITEADRTSKYIMIAGGGGGAGGAEDGSSRKANGGAGGNNNSASGIVGGENSVAGVYFAGANGTSSGNSTSYVGKGGTNVPGATSNSMWGITDANYQPPDNWFGTVSGKGGSGGSGELRGGGGGAGFAGGSGGLMTSVLFASNIGGGGGGSSFIASTVNDISVQYFSLSDKDAAHLENTNPSSVGGALKITYLDGEDLSFLDNMTIKGCLSPYVLPLAAGFVAEDGNPSSELEVSYKVVEHNHETLIISGFSLRNEKGDVGGFLHITLQFGYSNGFLGGNNVPILYNHGYELDSPMTLFFGDGRETVIEIGEVCGYVNFPYVIEAHGHSNETNSPGTSIPVNALYYDQFATVRASFEDLIVDDAERYKYGRILEIGNYEVYDTSGKMLDVNGIVSPNTTTHYTVVIPVKMTPISDTGYATVGRRNVPDADGWIRFKKDVSIVVPGSRVEQLGKFMTTYTKSLDFDEESGNYIFTLEIKSSTSKENNITPTTDGVNHVVNFDSSSVVEYEHVIEVTGWYLIQAWGGNGGRGGNSLIGSGSGGAGGKGGYVQGYVHLDRGDTIDIFMGVNGADNSSKWTQEGPGGKHSRVSLVKANGESTVLMIAGGGGGGGAYNWGAGREGESVFSTYTTTAPNASNEYSAYDGKTGNGRDGGSAGSNYINTALVKTSIDQNDGFDDYAENLFNGAQNGDYSANTHGGGTTHVKCLMVTDDGDSDVIQEIEKTLTDYAINTTISKYFKIEDVSFGAGELDERYGDPKINYNYTSGSDTALSVDGICPIVLTSTTGDEKTHYASTEFRMYVTLSVADGFLGGNDVPVFKDGVTLLHTQYEEVDGDKKPILPRPSIVLGDNDAADYANVAIDYSILPEVLRPEESLFYQPDDDAVPIPKEALYRTNPSNMPLPVAPEKNSVDSWKYDYVEIVNTVEDIDDKLSPTLTTEYEVTVGIRPASASSKAKTDVKKGGVLNQEEKIHSHITIIFVGHEVIFDLTNLTHNAESLHDRYAAELGEDFTFKLDPIDDDHLLPDNIVVKVGNAELAEGELTYEYTRGSGEVIIKADVITDTVTVSAVAKAPRHKVNYYYAESPDATTFKKVVQEYGEGKPLENAYHLTYIPNEFEGYSFSWDWGDGNTEAPTVMSDSDLFAIGTYTPNSYTLTVNYIYADGSTSSESRIYVYNQEYFISIPQIDGYLAKVDGAATTAISGQMGAQDMTITVIYEASEATLTVVYLHAKTGEQLKSYINECNTGEAYSIDIEQFTGYVQSKDGKNPDPEWTKIEGTMPENGISVTVYCIPKTYTVIFEAADENGESYEYARREVAFGEIYGVDATNGEYSVFGEPARAHHSFLYWYIKDTETRIEEDDVVGDNGDIILVAKWEVHTYTITVKYLFEDGSDVYPEEPNELAHGAEYKFIAKDYSGFTPTPPLVSGKVEGQDLVLVFTYISEYPTEPIIAATVTWGDLSFGFEAGMWDPETHTYKEDTFTPNTEGENTITIKNDDSHVYVENGNEYKRESISINAEVIFNALYEYRDLSGRFTSSSSPDSVATEGEEEFNAVLDIGESETVYFWLVGNFEPTAIGNYAIGSCTVTLRGGDIQK